VNAHFIAMPLSSSFVIRSSAGLLGAALAVLLIIVGMTIWLGERAQMSFSRVADARNVRGIAVELRNAVQTAESSQRGFIATSNEIYLAPYGRAKAQTARQLQALERTRVQQDSPVLMSRLAAAIASKIGEMDQSIALKTAREDEAALALLRSNRGKALMDEIEVFVSGVTRAADERLTSALEEQRANAGLLRWVSVVGGLIILVIVGIVVATVHRYTVELAQARDHVASVNATLEQRVAQRTSDLAQARERAETLLKEVNHRVANSLAMVAALVRLQDKGVTDQASRDALDEARARIEAIALVHKRLYSSGDVTTVALDEYLASLIEHLRTSMLDGGHTASVKHDLAPLQLNTDASVNLGVVVAEWVTNAFKYAYADRKGEIRVKLKSRDDGRGELIVEDDGVGRGPQAVIKGTGLGTRIVATMASSMQAEVDYLTRQPGTTARLVFPLGPQPTTA
jgi:two-component sensor histidine kinase/CHASE3 domain sensor protein